MKEQKSRLLDKDSIKLDIESQSVQQLNRLPSSASTKLENSQHIEQNQQMLSSPEIIVHDPIDRKKVLLACLFSLMTTQTLFLNVENVLPTWIPENQPSINSIQISFILSAFELSSLIFSPFIGKYLDKIGRKNSIMMGDIILIIATIGMGTTQFFAKPNTYLGVSIALRLLQGFGNAQVQVACYAIITYVFADNREKYLGYAEAFTGLGLMIGPVIGGLLYVAVGYFWTFTTFGVILGFSMIATFIITPNSLNDSVSENQENNNENEQNDIKQKVSFGMFLLNKRSLFAYSSCCLVGIFINYQSSFLSDVLVTQKGVPQAYTGFILALPCLTYTLSCFGVNLIVSRLPRRIFILVSFMLLSVALMFQGPSQMIGIPDHLWIVLFGFALNGMAQGFIFIPLLPDAIEAVYIKENYVEGKSEQLDQLISDYGSGLYGAFFSSGQILAPIVGGVLYEFIGYRQTTDFIMLACVCWCIIFFIFNVGFTIFKQEKKNQEKMEILKSRAENNKSSINSTGDKKKKDEEDEEEELEEFLKLQRDKWKKIKQKQNQQKTNLSAIEETKGETVVSSEKFTFQGSNILQEPALKQGLLSKDNKNSAVDPFLLKSKLEVKKFQSEQKLNEEKL